MSETPPKRNPQPQAPPKRFLQQVAKEQEWELGVSLVDEFKIVHVMAMDGTHARFIVAERYPECVVTYCQLPEPVQPVEDAPRRRRVFDFFS